MSNEFGILLKRHRKYGKLTQEELREKLNKQVDDVDPIHSKGTICRWENGQRKPKQEYVEALEEVFFGKITGILLNPARYFIELELEKQPHIEMDPIISKSREEHFKDLAEICRILLVNDLYKVMSDRIKGEEHLYYYVINDDWEKRELNQSQLAECLENNISEVVKLDPWFFWYCFMPHLQEECPDIELNDLSNATGRNAFQIIEIVRILANKKIFKGICPVCKDCQ